MAVDDAGRSTALRVRDSFALPEGGDAISARAERVDTYSIHAVRSLEELVARLLPLLKGSRVALISDATVDRLHGTALRGALAEASVEVASHNLPPGERSKSAERALELWDWLADTDIARLDLIITHGGGVINDLGGFAASVYMRGLPYVNLPTTLLAQVDGAMGGKVAANHPTAKNLLGAFYQPIGVISNVAYLETLDLRHLRAGLAESIKKAVIASPHYWEFIDDHAERILAKDLASLERLVVCAAAIKTRLIERDPYEQDLRRPLNFGHTVGHPVETITGYGAILHGEAVAFGMVVEARIAANRGLLPAGELNRLIGLLSRVGLPVSAGDLNAKVDIASALAAMGMVRRIRAGSLRYVLPVALGETLIADDVSEAEVRRAMRESGMPATASA